MKYSDLARLEFQLLDAPKNYLPTISEIAAKNKANGGHMFDRQTLKFFKDKLSNWKPKRGSDGKLYLRHKRGEVRGVESDWSLTVPLEIHETDILTLSNK